MQPLATNWRRKKIQRPQTDATTQLTKKIHIKSWNALKMNERENSFYISNMDWIYFIPNQSSTNILHGYKLVCLPYKPKCEKKFIDYVRDEQCKLGVQV